MDIITEAREYTILLEERPESSNPNEASNLIKALLTNLEEKEREVERLQALHLERTKFTHEIITERDKLKAENERLIREVEILRQYGNKDCTAMADEALASLHKGKEGG